MTKIRKMGKKITVVGAGFVGATCARRIIEKDLADVVLIDIIEGLPQGRALDLMESAPIEGYSSQILGTNEYKDTKNSDIVIVTAGIARKPGMSRDDLLQTNAKIIKDVITKIVKESPNAILIMVTNPLDVMSYYAYKISGFESKRVIGMAGVLDSARYRFFIAEALGVTPSLVNAFVLATPISGPACKYNPPSTSLAIELPTTLTTPREVAPDFFACFKASKVSAVSPLWLITITKSSLLKGAFA